MLTMFNMQQMDDDIILFTLYSTFLYLGLSISESDDDIEYAFSRNPKVDYTIERESYVNSIIYGTHTHCINQIRMSPPLFFKFCDLLSSSGLVRETHHMRVKE